MVLTTIKDYKMKTFTVCHKGFGYITHSYVTADDIFEAIATAANEFTCIMNVQPLHR